MKNTTLRGLFAATLLLVANAAMAQDTASKNAEASARVYAKVEVAKDFDLRFGTVIQNVSKTIAVTSDSAAVFTVTKDGLSVSLELSGLAPLQLENSTTTMGTAYTTAIYNVSDDTARDEVFAGTEATRTVSLGQSVGNVTVRIGGTVTPAQNQTTGTYKREITLTATYN